MANVPSSNLAALYSNTTAGLTASPTVVDAAIQDIVATINSNSDTVNTLISSDVLSELGIINVKDYGASGLATTAIGSITSGTKILTLTTTPDFVQGQGINLQGAFEVASLLVTAGASSSANCTITLNGTGTTVALTSGNTATQVATAIRAATFTGWTTGGSGTTVTFTSTTTGTKTDASYSAGSTGATGTMSTTTQGTADQISTVSSVSGLVVTIADNATRTITTGTILHDDTVSLQTALDIVCAEIRFGNSDNNYMISSGLIFADDVFNNLETCIISANFSNGNITRTKYYASGKKTFTVKGNRAIITGYGGHTVSTELTGLYVDSCNFSIFEGIVIQGCEHSVILAPTGDEDIKNIMIKGIETNTAKGIKILSGEVNGVDYQETTTGKIEDCFWTCTGASAKAFEVICNDHTDTSVSSVFGIIVSRCSLNPTDSAGGTMIDMRAGGSSSIYSMTFENCEGEIRYSGSTPTIPLIYLDTVNESEFDVKGYYQLADGIQLVNSRNNVFKNMIDGNIDTTNTGRFIVLDSTSNSNYFENVGFLLNEMSTELGITNAPLSAYFFKNRIVDNGQLNSFSGMITSYPQRIFNTRALSLISSTGSDLLNPLVTGQQTTSTWVRNSDYTYTLTTTTEAGFYFRVPLEIPLGTKIVYRIKYKFNSTIGSLAGWCIKTSSDDASVRTVPMSMTSTYTDQMFLGVATTRENRIMSTSSQTNVVLQIAKLEMFIGGFPYPYNYSPSDIIRDNFLESPYLDTSLRPAHANVYIGWTYYDTALEKLVSSNGTQWRSNGSIV